MNNQKLLINTEPAAKPSRTVRSSAVEETPAVTGKRRRIIRLYLTAIFLLSSMLVVYVWQSTKMIEVKLGIKKLEKYIEEIENSNAELRTERSRLMSLTRIESEARTNLGMIEPKNRIYIAMPDKWKEFYD